jgi:hypothetical protein
MLRGSKTSYLLPKQSDDIKATHIRNHRKGPMRPIPVIHSQKLFLLLLRHFFLLLPFLFIAVPLSQPLTRHFCAHTGNTTRCCAGGCWWLRAWGVVRRSEARRRKKEEKRMIGRALTQQQRRQKEKKKDLDMHMHVWGICPLDSSASIYSSVATSYPPE